MLHQLARLFIHLIVKGTLKLVTHVESEGAHHLRQPGAYIIASNHLTNWDAPLIYSQMPFGKPLVPIAADKWRDVLPIRWLLDSIDAVWIKRGEVDRDALRAITQVLKSGRAVGIAPEGTRSKTKALQPAKPGVAWLARSTGVPIIPVAVWGVEDIAPNLKRLRRTCVHIHFAPPITLAREADVNASTAQIMHTIAALLPERYRGVYRGMRDEG
jgi:1-acyl-sn-glycerol-3-phosphate acyltransferase